MVKKNNESLPPWLLFVISAILLSAGWLMKSFPIFIFFGLAPLFAIADQAKEGDDFWVHIEFILLALAASFFAAHAFNVSFLVSAIVQAIVFAIAFSGYSFSYQSLGSRLGKFTIIFFWLGIEYILLKLPWREQTIFLTDAIQLRPEWVKWNSYTGYLGSTLWILITNLLLYMAVFKGKSNWYLLAITIICLAAPIIYSLIIKVEGINRMQMISLYSNVKVESINYVKRGELVTRTAAWISVVIVLLALVKSRTKKK
jgi:apolipoprotein N-acyltransferase